VKYLMKASEAFARAFAQYIALRSPDKELKADFDAERVRREAAQGYPFQWSDEEFAPIAAYFDRTFKELGWLKEKRTSTTR
jgi:hypothetical protein